MFLGNYVTFSLCLLFQQRLCRPLCRRCRRQLDRDPDRRLRHLRRLPDRQPQVQETAKTRGRNASERDKSRVKKDLAITNNYLPISLLFLTKKTVKIWSFTSNTVLSRYLMIWLCDPNSFQLLHLRKWNLIFKQFLTFTKSIKYISLWGFFNMKLKSFWLIIGRV